MNQTVYEQGIEKGIEKGARSASLRIVEQLLIDRFGNLSDSAKEVLSSKSELELRELSRKIYSAKSLANLGL